MENPKLDNLTEDRTFPEWDVELSLSGPISFERVNFRAMKGERQPFLTFISINQTPRA